MADSEPPPRVNPFDLPSNPLLTRYSTTDMSRLFSPTHKVHLWRRLWHSLAETERELGLEHISQDALDELASHLHPTEKEMLSAAGHERKMRHDVMAQITALGEECPLAKPIIHLGATSCFVKDNAYLMQMRDALSVVRTKLVPVIRNLALFAEKNKALPTLGYTHFQPAQLVTVGKRAALWGQDFVMDLMEVDRVMGPTCLGRLFRGVKGTTGTQASFLRLFKGDHDKVRMLDERVTEKMGFSNPVGLTGQTYPRKIDFYVLSVLSSIAQSASKFATDVRLLMSMRELDEPMGADQIGSSAMAYKRNPMKCERVCALSRFVMSLVSNTAHTASVQWFERSLDDSANRRLVISQGFMATDGILRVVATVTEGMKAWPLMIRNHVARELPFMATENVIMDLSEEGGDRQDIHDIIRRHSFDTVKLMKEKGQSSTVLLEKFRQDERLTELGIDLESAMDEKSFIGRCPEQVDEFVAGVRELLGEDIMGVQEEGGE